MGDVRADGFQFKCYQKHTLKSGAVKLEEIWLRPEVMARFRKANRQANKNWGTRKAAERKEQREMGVPIES